MAQRLWEVRGAAVMRVGCACLRGIGVDRKVLIGFTGGGIIRILVPIELDKQ